MWVIETKSDENPGQDKNIDKQTENKFSSFKKYASGKVLHWALDMADEHWIPITQEF